MISAVAGATAICCFAVSYVSHQILPVKPIEAKTPKDYIDLYLNKQETFDELSQSLRTEEDVRSLYKMVTGRIESENAGSIESLKKSLEEKYTYLKSSGFPNISVSITREGSQQVPVQSPTVPLGTSV